MLTIVYITPKVVLSVTPYCWQAYTCKAEIISQHDVL